MDERGERDGREAARWRVELMSAAETGDAERAKTAAEALRGLLGEPERLMALRGALSGAIRAMEPGAAGVCEELVKQGADPQACWLGALGAWQRAPDGAAQEAARVARALARAEFIDAGAVSGEQASPLWSLCHHPGDSRERALEVASFLLERGANPNHLNARGRPALLGPLRPSPFGYPEGLSEKLTALLLRHGADPRLGPKGEAPLEAARDPEMRGRLQAGGREILDIWAEADEIRSQMAPKTRGSRARKGL